jgi:hypothetical protein
VLRIRCWRFWTRCASAGRNATAPPVRHRTKLRHAGRPDLTALEYGYDRQDAILLERKDDMRKRGLASPDDGDALALRFAYPVANNAIDDDTQDAPRSTGWPRTSGHGRSVRTGTNQGWKQCGLKSNPHPERSLARLSRRANPRRAR